MVWTDDDRRRLWAQQAARQRAEMEAAAAARAARLAQQQADAEKREKDFQRTMAWIDEQARQNQRYTHSFDPIRFQPVDSFPQPERKSGKGALLVGILVLIAIAMILGRNETTNRPTHSPKRTYESAPAQTAPADSPQPIQTARPTEPSETAPAVSAPPLQSYPGSADQPADVPAANGDAQTIAPTPPDVRPPPVEQGSIALQVIDRVMPAYPPLARQARVEGPVELSVEVSPDGSVRDVRVIKGFALLNQAAIDAVRQWRYQPYVAASGQGSQRTQVTVNFRLN
jgi:TonB family protein